MQGCAQVRGALTRGLGEGRHEGPEWDRRRIVRGRFVDRRWATRGPEVDGSWTRADVLNAACWRLVDAVVMRCVRLGRITQGATDAADLHGSPWSVQPLARSAARNTPAWTHGGHEMDAAWTAGGLLVDRLSSSSSAD